LDIQTSGDEMVRMLDEEEEEEVDVNVSQELKEEDDDENINDGSDAFKN
jgi:hypothetical protein